VIVCVCNCVNHEQIGEIIEKAQPGDLAELQTYMEVANQCGACKEYIEGNYLLRSIPQTE